MQVQLLYVDGCPNVTVADERLRAALARVGHVAEVEHVLVESWEDAEAVGFTGSPTISVDGRDPFARGDEPVALACRIYPTPHGPSGSPTIEQLVEVLRPSHWVTRPSDLARLVEPVTRGSVSGRWLT